MTPRSRLKYWFHENFPGFVGRFRYFDVQVHFPKGSVIFKMICEQGFYERENARLLSTLAGKKADGYVFDVGANIGSMAIPVLDARPSCRMVSFEPSPQTSQCLKRTIAGSRFRDRWQLVEKAVGEAEGVCEFFAADSGMDAYNGFANTERSAGAQRLEVPVTTLDLYWKHLGHPPVSAVKIDVEGAELRVLEGAKEMIAAERPAILLEWNALNLRAYNKKPGDLLKPAHDMAYRVFSVPNLIPVQSAEDLEIQMLQTESFLLVPEAGPSGSEPT
jgi:FkbM family methyltransferase